MQDIVEIADLILGFILFSSIYQQFQTSSRYIHFLGGTPLGMYRALIKMYQDGELSFKHVKTFNMDEYCGLPRDHPESYHYYMWSNFFKHIDIDPKNVNLLDGNAPDLCAECDRYEEEIKKAGGINLFVGGKAESFQMIT